MRMGRSCIGKGLSLHAWRYSSMMMVAFAVLGMVLVTLVSNQALWNAQSGDVAKTTTIKVSSPFQHEHNILSRAETPSPNHSIAILHFGPRKTGTTTLQYALSASSKSLAHEGFVYVGNNMNQWYKGAHWYMLRCISYNRTCTSDVKGARAFLRFQDLVANHSSVGTYPARSLIFSDEGIPRFSRMNGVLLDVLAKMFSPYTERRVTVTYRHYAEWYLSEYNQEQKQRKSPIGFVDWHRSSRDPQKLRSFEAVTRNHLDLYGRRFNASVRVFNMHQGGFSGDLVVRWVAAVVPEASTTLRSLQDESQKGIQTSNNTKSSRHVNPSSTTIEGRRVARLFLEELGYQPDKVPKGSYEILVGKVQQFIDSHRILMGGHNVASEGSNASSLRICLTDEEETDIWHRTIQTRDELVPGYDPENIELQASFDKAKRHFCQTDYKNLWSWPPWRSFVRTLKGI